MKFSSKASAPTYSVADIADTIERALASAGLRATDGPMRDVTDTIRRALTAGGIPAPGNGGSVHADASCIDVEARVVEPGQGRGSDAVPSPAARVREAPGRFVTHQYRDRSGTRAYKLYVPARTSSAPMPVIVMLHGCTQSAEDFATGTRMNQLAEAHGFLVVYPEQGPGANPSNCWNWFNPGEQLREGAEPASIAGIVREVVERHEADPRRVYVAGLSAGAAMALVLGQTHPECFAGVGVHSGLPYGSAHDIPSAMLAMKGGRSGLVQPQGLPGAVPPPPRAATEAVPLVVFHGDRDHTVQHANARAIVEQAAQAHARAGAVLQLHSERGTAKGGRDYTCTRHVDAAGQTRIECWTVHGAGHAWSGGDPGGSYTDAQGPDASAEMLRFFLSLPRGGTA